jgi:uncharacterized damage-inducible protein DinB
MRIAPLLITAVFAARLMPAADPLPPTMTDAQRTQILDLLKASKAEFFAAIEGVTPEQWKWKSSPERWSIGEVAEHIVLAEGGLFAKMQEALKNPIQPDWAEKTAGKTELLLRVMAPRQGKAKAPDEIVPQGKWDYDQAKAAFEKIRAETTKFTETTQAEMNARTSEHPFPVFKTLSAYQWLIYIPLHNQRHVKQILEVKATPGFPK